MVKLKLNTKLSESQRVTKSFIIGKEVIEDLGVELKRAGYKRGLADIHFSEFLSDLIKEYITQLKRDNDEDESNKPYKKGEEATGESAPSD